MDLLHRKAQSYKFSNKNDLFCAWRDFNKTFCGISTYHKWMFKLQISSIFNFDRAHQRWISGLLGVKKVLLLIMPDLFFIWGWLGGMYLTLCPPSPLWSRSDGPGYLHLTPLKIPSLWKLKNMWCCLFGVLKNWKRLG